MFNRERESTNTSSTNRHSRFDPLMFLSREMRLERIVQVAANVYAFLGNLTIELPVELLSKLHCAFIRFVFFQLTNCKHSRNTFESR